MVISAHTHVNLHMDIHIYMHKEEQKVETVSLTFY